MPFKRFRIKDEKDCPGTCCLNKSGTMFPDEATGKCRYHDSTLDRGTRKFGGCTIYGKASRDAEPISPDERQWVVDACVGLPNSKAYVQVGVRGIDKVQPDFSFELPDGTKWCECWEWRSIGN